MGDLVFVVAGLGTGMVFGLFGAGGSAFATPVLALLGVPAPLAVASPLPAMVPAAFAGARRYLKAQALDLRTAKLAIVGGVPGTVVGALVSAAIGGQRLLLLSGLMLLIVGARVVLPDPVGSSERAAARRSRTELVVGAAFVVGVFTGVLANGGGFLLVPLFIVVLGLGATEAAGTSMVAVGALVVPTMVTHWFLGHIDWNVALAFGGGMLPGSLVGSRVAQRIPARVLRPAFGVMLTAFATVFLAHSLHI
jgi:uncharacterized membrane protein YfcA